MFSWINWHSLLQAKHFKDKLCYTEDKAYLSSGHSAVKVICFVFIFFNSVFKNSKNVANILMGKYKQFCCWECFLYILGLTINLREKWIKKVTTLLFSKIGYWILNRILKDYYLNIMLPKSRKFNFLLLKISFILISRLL